jgi:hypothetical protein
MPKQKRILIFKVECEKDESSFFVSVYSNGEIVGPRGEKDRCHPGNLNAGGIGVEVARIYKCTVLSVTTCP